MRALQGHWAQVRRVQARLSRFPPHILSTLKREGFPTSLPTTCYFFLSLSPPHSDDATYTDIVFAKVDVDECPDAAEEAGVSVCSPPILSRHVHSLLDTAHRSLLCEYPLLSHRRCPPSSSGRTVRKSMRPSVHPRTSFPRLCTKRRSSPRSKTSKI